jgi:hypothetical protein
MDIRGTEQKLEEHALRQAIIFAGAAWATSKTFPSRELDLKKLA